MGNYPGQACPDKARSLPDCHDDNVAPAEFFFLTDGGQAADSVAQRVAGFLNGATKTMDIAICLVSKSLAKPAIDARISRRVRIAICAIADNLPDPSRWSAGARDKPAPSGPMSQDRPRSACRASAPDRRAAPVHWPEPPDPPGKSCGRCADRPRHRPRRCAHGP